MATLKYYFIGNSGPYYYDPDEAVTAEDADADENLPAIPAQAAMGFNTDGKARVGSAPTEDDHVLRRVDMLSAGGDLELDEGKKIIFDADNGSNTYIYYQSGKLYIVVDGQIVAVFP